jgi:hypothetical protein
MGAGFLTTRRNLLAAVFRIAAFGPAASFFSQAGSLEDAGPAVPPNTPTGKAQFRRYRVQATVSIPSIPVIGKEGVGTAGLFVEEEPAGYACTTAVQFVGGSWPDRIKGLNRFGMTQEVVREESGAVRESAYLSLMTSSPEKNSDQAWQAFADRPRNLTLAVACGLVSATGYRWALERKTVPAEATWMDCPSLMERFRGQQAALREGVRPDGSAHESVYPTFLISVRKAILQRATGRCTFIHNAKLYDLHTRFSEAYGSVLLTGQIAERGSPAFKTETGGFEFRVWLDPDDVTALPSKFEFRPRSFLRLTFHLDPTAGGPSFRPLIPRKEA